MKRKTNAAKIILLTIFLCIAITGILAEADEKPSIIVLMHASSTLSKDELLEIGVLVSETIAESKTSKVVVVDPSVTLWPTLYDAVNFSKGKDTDYTLYLSPTRQGDLYSITAKLLKTKTGTEVAPYWDFWMYQPASTEAMEKVAHKVASYAIHYSSGKITVNITIISKPPYSDVYRDNDRLGDTGENGFRKTYWWDRGQYQIRVCKPGRKDYSEVITVEGEPTDIHWEVVLSKK